MTPVEIRDARLYLGLSFTELGRALGFKGTHVSVSRKIRRIEAGNETLGPDKVGALKRMLEEARSRPGVVLAGEDL